MGVGNHYPWVVVRSEDARKVSYASTEQQARAVAQTLTKRLGDKYSAAIVWIRK